MRRKTTCCVNTYYYGTHRLPGFHISEILDPPVVIMWRHLYSLICSWRWVISWHTGVRMTEPDTIRECRALIPTLQRHKGLAIDYGEGCYKTGGVKCEPLF